MTRWWGGFSLGDGDGRLWRVGPLELGIVRAQQEWSVHRRERAGGVEGFVEVELMENFLQITNWYPVVRAVVAVGIGLVLAQLVRAAAGKILAPRVSPQHTMLGKRAVYYLVLGLALLSGLLRTFDKLFVRVPNESLVKAEITNLSRFPIRRYDLQLGVAYKENIGRVRDVVLEVADVNPLCLQEPRPQIIFQGFGDSSVNLQFSVWAARENYLLLRNSMAEEVKVAFDDAGIEIPFPHRTIYAGSQTEPLPIALVPEPTAPNHGAEADVQP